MQTTAPTSAQSFPTPVITPHPQPGLRGVAIVVSALLAIMVDGTSTAIINTGLPYLQGSTAASPDEGSWIISSFNAAYYAFILFSPWMMARFGNRKVVISALSGFTVLSLLLAATTDFSTFLALRILQGACLGCVFVPAVILFFTSLPPTALRYAAPGFVLGAISGSTLGTLIGGYVADEFGGNMVFIPAAFATAITAALIVAAAPANDKPQRKLHFDGIGLALSLISFTAMQYISNEGERRNWFDDSSIVMATMVLIVAMLSFICYELFGTRNPHVDFRMFTRYRNLVVGSIINIIIGATGYSVTVLVLYLQASIGATPTAAGAIIPVRLATYALGVPTAFLLTSTRTLSVKSVIIIATLGSALGFLIFARVMTTTAEMASFIGVSLFFGLFYSMLSQPIGALVIGSIPLPLLAAGVSIYKLSSPFGTMIATGAIQSYISHRAAFFRTNIVGNIRADRPIIQQYLDAHHGNAGGLASLAIHEAQTLALDSAMSLYAVILLLIIPVVFFIKIEKKTERP